MPTSEAPDTTPFRALLIEDDPFDRDIFVHHYRACDAHAEIEVVPGADEAWQRMQAGPERNGIPQVIFLDLHLAGMPATEFIRRIRERPDLRSILLIAMTGNLACACAGPSDYGVHALLLKPIALADLSSLLVLARASRR